MLVFVVLVVLVFLLLLMFVEWGCVFEDGIVEVREGEVWCVVGQYFDGILDEVFVYFVCKFDDIVFKVIVLEQCYQVGGVFVSDFVKQVVYLIDEVIDVVVVGDFVGLCDCLIVFIFLLLEVIEQEVQQVKEFFDWVIVECIVFVEWVEVIVVWDFSKVQWKQVIVEMGELFDIWQVQQQIGFCFFKGVFQQFWKCFCDVCVVVDKQCCVFYLEFDDVYKVVCDVKMCFVECVEVFVLCGMDGIFVYCNLFDEWKVFGWVGCKVDDVFWVWFKVVGDVFYVVCVEQVVVEEVDFVLKIEVCEVFFEEVKVVVDEFYIKCVCVLLMCIQCQWDEIGCIFFWEKECVFDDWFCVIEQVFKGCEDVDWKKNNFEMKVCVNDMSLQLFEVIEKFEVEFVVVEKVGDKKVVKVVVDVFEVCCVWLSVFGG